MSSLFLVGVISLNLAQSTDRADWYRMGNLKVKSGTCEKFLRKTEERLGVRVPRFTYIRVQTPSDVAELSGRDIYASGVADSQSLRIISTEACSRHEIVHLVTRQLGYTGRAGRMFEEGAATMLAGGSSVFDRWLMHRDARDIARRYKHQYGTIERRFTIDLAYDPQIYQWYVLSDAWVRHLVKKHDMARLIVFFRVSNEVGDAHTAFRLVYGTDLDATFHQWLYGNRTHSSPS